MCAWLCLSTLSTFQSLYCSLKSILTEKELQDINVKVKATTIEKVATYNYVAI